jgi:predicted Zn-dependent protease
LLKNTDMLSQSDFETLAETVLSLPTADETEVLFSGGEDTLTRFADNHIHQNLCRKDAGLTVRVHVGNKIGRASTNSFAPEALKTLVDHATEIAVHQSESPDFLPMPEKQRYKKIENFDEETAFVSPSERAEKIKEAVEKCRERALTAAGSYSTGYGVRAIANSKGVLAFHKSSKAHFTITATSASSSGWAEESSFKASSVPFRSLTDLAIDKAVAGQNPIELEPGRYTVVLEPSAASEFLLFMAHYGFGALSFLEGRSFLSGKLGQKLFGSNISIVDDAYHPLCRGLPFDCEGMPRKKVTLVEHGIVTGLVHDRKTALAMAVESTGHALPQPNPYGPIPENVVFERGDSTLREMIASTERGLLITQFHYCNVENPMHLILTGITRNGTFLIEGGKLRCGIRNFRFTESGIRIFNEVEKISAEQKVVGAFFGGEFVVPSLKVRDFTFTSKAVL